MDVNGPPPEWDEMVATSAGVPTSLEVLNAQRTREGAGPERATAASEIAMNSGRSAAWPARRESNPRPTA